MKQFFVFFKTNKTEFVCLFLIVSFFSSNAQITQKFCGLKDNHPLSHDNETSTDFTDDLQDQYPRYCYTDDIEARTNIELTEIPFPILDGEYAPTQIFVVFKEGVLADFGTNPNFSKGRFGIQTIDEASIERGLLRIESLNPEDIENNHFILTFAHPKNIPNVIAKYKNLMFYDSSGHEVPFFDFVSPNYTNTLSIDSVPQTETASSNITHREQNPSWVSSDKTAANYPNNFFKITEDPLLINQWHLHNQSVQNNPHDQSIDALRALSIFTPNLQASVINIAICDSSFYLPAGNVEINQRNPILIKSNLTQNQSDKEFLSIYTSNNFSHGNAIFGSAFAKSDNYNLFAGLDNHSKPFLFDHLLVMIGYVDGRGVFRNKKQIVSNPYWSIINLNYKNRNLIDVPKIINFSFKQDKITEDLKNAYLKLINENKNLLVVSAGNNYLNLDSSPDLYPKTYAKNHQNVMLVGGTDQLGNIWNDGVEFNGNRIGSNYGSFVSVVAPAKDILLLSHIDSSGFSYGNGTSYAAPQVSALASNIFYLLSNKPIANDNPVIVRQIIEITADKSKFAGNVPNNNGITFYNNVRDTYLARGLINAHQAILLTRALLNDEGIKNTPIKIGMEIKIMNYDQMIFSDNGNYAMALNKHRLTGYRIIRDDSLGDDQFNQFNHGAIWDTKTLSQQGFLNLTPNEAKNKYAKSLVLQGNEYFIENFDGDRNLLIQLANLNEHRELSIMDAVEFNHPFCFDKSLLCHVRKKEEDYYDEPGNTNYTTFIASQESTRKHNEKVTAGEYDPKDQWFEVEGENDKKGHFIKGDNTVKRRYRKQGKFKSIVHWSTSKGKISYKGEYKRFLLEDFIYDSDQGEDRITPTNSLNDNEILYSTNGGYRIFHHKGIIVSQKKYIDETTKQEVWGNKWVIDTTNPASVYYRFGFSDYEEHRLTLSTSGQLEYQAGYEDEAQQFIKQTSINIGTECDGTTNQGSYVFQLGNDGSIITYDGNDTLLNLFNLDTMNTDSKIDATKKIIPLNQIPQTNAVNSLLSTDKLKFSYFHNQSIKVVQREFLGDFCLNKPILNYTP